MIFGNWNVTNEGISWQGSPFQRFSIPAAQLTTTTRIDNSETMLYEWIMLATAEDWLTENDLYDLNYAFVFAIVKSGLDFDYTIFDDTLAEQFEQFEAEDNEDG